MPGDKTPRKLIWPAGLRVTVLRRQWFDRFSALPPGLSLKQIEERLGESYASVALWAKCFGYPATKLPRGRKSLTNWDAVDWSKKNCDIAREMNVSGERVRQIREARHLPPTQRLSDAGQRFRQYIAANRRRLQKWSIRQIIVQSGANISTATAHTILKQS